MSIDKYTCPCCGYKTLDEPPPGTFEICGLCGWEDDAIQFGDPDYEGGANGESLREAQHNFHKSTETYWNILPPHDGNSRTKNIKTNFIGNKDGTIKKL